jgi:hypothetical protein
MLQSWTLRLTRNAAALAFYNGLKSKVGLTAAVRLDRSVSVLMCCDDIPMKNMNFWKA